MSPNRRALVFDVDGASLGSIQEALPGWKMDVVYGATVGSLPCDWDPEAVDLLIVGPRADMSQTLNLCRFLSYRAPFAREYHRDGVGVVGLGGSPADAPRRPDAPLLVLVPPARRDMAAAALRAGAHQCLLLPITAGDVTKALRPGDSPRRHTRDHEDALGIDGPGWFQAPGDKRCQGNSKLKQSRNR